MAACEGPAGLPGEPGEPGQPGAPGEAPGLPPQVSDPIADLTLVAGTSQTINLNEHFLDPDAEAGESLSFAAESSNAASVSATVAGGTLTVRATAVAGMAKVTVKATDVDGLINRDVFDVTVTEPPPANRAPTPEGVIAEVDVVVGSSTTVDVSMYFTDPDEGDTLTYTATVPESEKDVSVSVAEGTSVVTIEGKTEGSATVTVTATDAGGLSAEQTINVDVNAVSRGAPPQTVGTPMKITLGAKGSETVDVSKYFNHPDGGALTYTAKSNNAAVTATITGSSMMVTANNETTSALMAEIDVTATDSDEQTAKQRFDVMVEAMAPAVTTEYEVHLNSNKKLIVDAMDHFTAMEGATYAADPLGGVVEATMVAGSKTKFEIQPIQKGTDTVLLTQTSKDKLTVNEEEITVTVPNQAPERTREVYTSDSFTGEEQTAAPYKGLFKFAIDELEDYFKDDDDDALTYKSTYSTNYAKVLKVANDYIIVDIFSAKSGRVISVPVFAEDDGDPDVDADNARSVRTVRVKLEIDEVGAQTVAVEERTADMRLRDTRNVQLRVGPGSENSMLTFGMEESTDPVVAAEKGSIGFIRKARDAATGTLTHTDDAAIVAAVDVMASGTSIELLKCATTDAKPMLALSNTDTDPEESPLAEAHDNQYKLCFKPKAIGTTTITLKYTVVTDETDDTDATVEDKFKVVVVRPKAKTL